MGVFTNSVNNFRRKSEAALQEARLHDNYAADLLRKNGIPEIDWTPLELEKMGYQLEHYVDLENGEEIHEWRLFKLHDTSPRYKVQRVISILEDTK